MEKRHCKQLLHCCAPGCTTYDVNSNFLHFPVNYAWREKWLAAMPKKPILIDHNSVLCLKHFAWTDVAVFKKCSSIGSGDGRNVKKSDLPLIKKGACPQYFPNEIGEKMTELKVCIENGK